jgi:hypothetical protein
MAVETSYLYNLNPIQEESMAALLSRSGLAHAAESDVPSYVRARDDAGAALGLSPSQALTQCAEVLGLQPGRTAALAAALAPARAVRPLNVMTLFGGAWHPSLARLSLEELHDARRLADYLCVDGDATEALPQAAVQHVLQAVADAQPVVVPAADGPSSAAVASAATPASHGGTVAAAVAPVTPEAAVAEEDRGRGVGVWADVQASGKALTGWPAAAALHASVVALWGEVRKQCKVAAAVTAAAVTEPDDVADGSEAVSDADWCVQARSCCHTTLTIPR